MAWIGSITDQETARKVNGSAIMANTLLGLGTSDITTVAVARAAAIAANLSPTRSICDRPIGQSCDRGFQVANNFSAMFGSTFAVLEASLPSSVGHPRQMIQS